MDKDLQEVIENSEENLGEDEKKTEDGVRRHTEDSPFSPFYVPDKKQKSNNRITIALVVVLLLVLIAGMIFAVSKLVEAAIGEAAPAWNEGVAKLEEIFDEWKKSGLEQESEKSAKENQEEFNYYQPVPEEELEGFEKFFKDYMDEYGNGEFPFDGNEAVPYEEEPYLSEEFKYVPSSDDEFYLELADAVRDDLSYSVKFEEYTHSNATENVDIYVEYVVVEGDIPAIDQINEHLENGAMYYVQELGAADVNDFYLSVESYVTYMDEETLSVVVDERYIIGDYEYIQIDLYCMNFDLKTGALLYNTDIVDATEKLAAAFRKQSDYQNGQSDIVQELSDKEITEYMADEDSLILYYTPVGLEVGFNYYDGWISATLKEYQDYLKKL